MGRLSNEAYEGELVLVTGRGIRRWGGVRIDGGVSMVGAASC